MTLIIKTLFWDSEFFGFPVSRFECDKVDINTLTQAIDNSLQDQERLIYLFVNPDDIESSSSIEGLGAQLVDRKVTYQFLLSSVAEIKSNENIKIVNQITPQLESLALQSGEFSRFKIDNKFPPHLFESMYRQWLINSVNRLVAFDVLAFQNDLGEEIGLLTLGEKNDRADIGLLAVDVDVRGRRIGQQLMQEAFILAAAKGYNEIQVVTQLDNTSACIFYEKLGFIRNKVEHVYHFWLE